MTDFGASQCGDADEDGLVVCSRIPQGDFRFYEAESSRRFGIIEGALVVPRPLNRTHGVRKTCAGAREVVRTADEDPKTCLRANTLPQTE